MPRKYNGNQLTEMSLGRGVGASEVACDENYFENWIATIQTFQPSRFDRETHGLGCQLTVRVQQLTVKQRAPIR